MYSPDDGPYGPKHVVIQREIININKELSVAITGIYLEDILCIHYTTGCTPQR
jgi:hypothetical protein